MSDRIANTAIVGRPDLAARARPFIQADDVRCYTMGPCRIIVAKEPGGWHLSISCSNRDPTWAEIATARYRLLPKVRYMAMYLPPLDEYVNLHPHVFHLFESEA